MLEYISILGHVSNLPFFVDNSQEFISAIERLLLDIEKIVKRKERHKDIGIENSKFLKTLISPIAFLFKLLTLRFLIKYFVESHIKGKMNLLRDSYIHLEQTLEPDKHSSEKLREWLERAEESSLKFATTLSSWQSIRGLASALWPLGISLLVAKFSMNDATRIGDSAVSEVDLISFIVLILILSVPILYFCLFIFFSFRYKRRLFLHELDVKHQLRYLKEEDVIGENAYQIENMLFILLGKRKSKEFPVDIVTYAIVSLPLFLFLTIIEWQKGNIAITLSLGAFLILFESIQIYFAIKRKWK
jgi:hypothetical protein